MSQDNYLTRHKKLIVLSLIIGVICGFSALALYYSISFVSKILLTDIIGFSTITTTSAGGVATTTFHIAHPYMIPLIMCAAALVGGLIAYTFSRETEGHGADAVIKSFHKKDGYVRRRVAAIELVNSSLTIGSGGSAGGEGPIALICASLGSTLSRYLHLSDNERKIISAVAVGSGISALLKAPLGGAIFGAEFLYKRDMEIPVIYPSLIASVVSFAIYGAFLGYSPLFGSLSFTIALNLFPFFIALGLASGLFSRVYIKVYHFLSNWFHHLNMKEYLKPAIGALFASVAILLVPETLGEGTAWMQMMINGNIASFAITYGLPLVVFFLLLALFKMIATSFTVGSGASGGIFIPGLFIGGAFATSVALLLNSLFPSIITTSTLGIFAIVGMVSFFGSTAKTPISLAVIGIELVGNLNLLPFIILAMFAGYIVSGNDTIFRSQLESRTIDKLVTPVATASS